MRKVLATISVIKTYSVYIFLIATVGATAGFVAPGVAQAQEPRIRARKLKPKAPTPTPTPAPTPGPTQSDVTAAPGEPLATAQPAPAPTPPPAKRFEGSVEGTLVLTSGNTKTENLGLGTTLFYRPDPWEYQIRSNYIHNTDQTTVTAEKFTLELRGGKQLNERTDVFVNLYYLNNRFAGFNHQITPDAGYGYEWILADPVQLRTEAALGYEFESRTDGSEASYPVGRLGLLFGWAWSPTSEFHHETNLIPSLRAAGDWRMRSETFVTAQVTSMLAMKISYRYEYYNAPVAGKTSGDSTTTAAIVAKF